MAHHHCKRCSDRLVDDDGDLSIMQLPVHIESVHVDMLCAILYDVQAPYDQYERLTKLTTKHQKNQMLHVRVLSYAKKWLLSDKPSSSDNKFNYADGDGNGEEEDDLDQFQDALEPPSLTFVLDISTEFHVSVHPNPRNSFSMCNDHYDSIMDDNDDGRKRRFIPF